jgi:hypothetical protein
MEVDKHLDMALEESTFMQIILEDNFKNLYIQKKKKACAKLI